MAWKKLNIGKERWKPAKIDKEALEEQVRKARHYLKQVETNSKIGSINVDIDYGELFDAVEALYGIIGIGRLAEDNAKRKAMVK